MGTSQLQLWPGGKLINVNEEGDRLLVRYGHDEPWRTPTPGESRAVRIEQAAERYADRMILCCDSALVEDALKLAGEVGGDWAAEWDLTDKVTNLYPDPSEWGLKQCKEWLDENGPARGRPDPDPWDMDRDGLLDALGEEDPDEDEVVAPDGPGELETDESLRARLIGEIDDETVDGLDAWREAVRDNAEAAEIYEWWRVDSWLAEQLAAVGECVLDNAYGQWWGRCTTGQGYIMDGVLQKVAAKFVS
jgi:hypothetical protein